MIDDTEENCVTAIAARHGRNYITPDDVTEAFDEAPPYKVRMDVLQVLSMQTSFGTENAMLCSFVAWQRIF